MIPLDNFSIHPSADVLIVESPEQSYKSRPSTHDGETRLGCYRLEDDSTELDSRDVITFMFAHSTTFIAFVFGDADKQCHSNEATIKSND